MGLKTIKIDIDDEDMKRVKLMAVEKGITIQSLLGKLILLGIEKMNEGK